MGINKKAVMLCQEKRQPSYSNLIAIKNILYEWEKIKLY